MRWVFGSQRSGQLHPVGDERGTGADHEFLLSGGHLDRGRAARFGGYGRAVEQFADGGGHRRLDELAGDADDRPLAARQRDGTGAVAGRVGGGDRGAWPSSAVTSARPGGFTWSNPSAVRSMTSFQSRIEIFAVSVTNGVSWIVCGPSGASARTCGPLPRSTATRVGWAGSSEGLGVSRSAATSVGRGSFSVRLAAVRCWTMFCGAVHDVRGSPSPAA